MNTITPTFEIVPAESGLEPAAKQSLEVAFSGYFKTAEEWKLKAAEITEAKEARSARLEIKGIRVAAEKTRKQLKEDSLRMGKAIDGANNILLALIVPIEQSLEDIEKAEERRIAAIAEAVRQERAEKLDAIGHAYPGVHLEALTDAEWQAYFQQAKDLYEIRQERERKAKEEAEAAAKKEAEEREAQRLENIRLKEEAAKREAEMEAEREAARKQAEAARKEREAIEAKAKAEREKAEAAAKEAARKQAEAEAQARALKAAEERRIAEEKASIEAKAKADALAAKKAAAAPDKEKLIEFASKVRALVVPLAKSEDGRAVAAEINAKVESFARWIEAQAATL